MINIKPNGFAGLTEPQSSVAATDVAPVTNSIEVSSSLEQSEQDSPAPTLAISELPPVNTQEPSSGDDEDEADPELESAYKTAQLSAKMRRLLDFAIVADLATGSPVDIIAKNYKLNVLYVQRVRGEWLKACKIQEAFDYRHELKVLALEAVRDGLKSKSDPFKRMSGGIRTLQGIGEFKPDQINVAVLQRIENVPIELRGRYITSTSDDEKVLEAEIVNGR